MSKGTRVFYCIFDELSVLLGNCILSARSCNYNLPSMGLIGNVDFKRKIPFETVKHLVSLIITRLPVAVT